MITQQDLDSLTKWFTSTVHSYYSKDPFIQQNILLKEQHTHRVCSNNKKRATALQLSFEEKLLAEVIALFHDLGRFEQFKQYQTFDDRRSINHAHLSVEMIKKAHLLSSLTQEEQQQILTAINHHNVHLLPKDGSSKWFYTKLLRDADKIDIYYVLANYYQQKDTSSNLALEFHLPKSDTIDPLILQKLFQHRIMTWDEVSTSTDMKLLQIAWVYDLNFPFSFQELVHQGSLDRIIASLPEGSEKQQIQKHIGTFVKAQQHNSSLPSDKVEKL